MVLTTQNTGLLILHLEPVVMEVAHELSKKHNNEMFYVIIWTVLTAIHTSRNCYKPPPVPFLPLYGYEPKAVGELQGKELGTQ